MLFVQSPSHESLRHFNPRVTIACWFDNPIDWLHLSKLQLLYLLCIQQLSFFLEIETLQGRGKQSIKKETCCEIALIKSRENIGYIIRADICGGGFTNIDVLLRIHRLPGVREQTGSIESCLMSQIS
jgi:hypothetical protein